MLKAYFLIAISGLSVLPVALSAEEQTATWVNTYGLSGGLIDMPTAEVGPDGRLITTIAHFWRDHENKPVHSAHSPYLRRFSLFWYQRPHRTRFWALDIFRPKL